VCVYICMYVHMSVYKYVYMYIYMYVMYVCMYECVCVCVCVCVYIYIYIYIKVKVKFSCYRPSVAQRVGRGIALLFHDCSTKGGEWSAARPGRTLPPGNTQYPLYRRLDGPQGRSGRAENLVPTGI